MAGAMEDFAVLGNGATFAQNCTAHRLKARRILNCPALAEDVVQDVMVRLIAEPPGGIAGVSDAYIGRMVRNLALDRVRRQRFERRLFCPLDHASDTEYGVNSTPEATAAWRESLRLVETALEALPEPVRTAFRLHRVEGVPQIEIARRLGVSRALVCGLVRRGHLQCLAALHTTRCTALTRQWHPRRTRIVCIHRKHHPIHPRCLRHNHYQTIPTHSSPLHKWAPMARVPITC